MIARDEISPRPAGVRSLYVDCTHVYQTRNTSGIARVVRNLAVLGSGMSNELSVDVRPILLTSRGFAVISPDWLTPRESGVVLRLARWCARCLIAVLRSAEALVVYAPLLARMFWAGLPERISSSARTIRGWMPTWLRARVRRRLRWFARHLADPYAGSIVTRWFFGLLRVALALVAGCGHLCARICERVGEVLWRFARSIGRAIRRGFQWMRLRRASLRRWLLAFRLRNKHVELGPSDVLLLADSNWDSGELWTRVANARSRGAIVASVMYDLIPLRRPDFVDQRLTSVFTEHLRRVTANNDFIIAISRDTCLDFLDFARSSGNPGWIASRARTFRLGGDKWTDVLTSCSEPCAEVVRLVGARPAYLVVGTFEIRKNHRAILDAFDSLWSDGTDVCLLILGRPGFRAGDQMARVRSHREWGSRLFWATNASDGDLESWYRASRGVIMASFAEGFGLPVAEALARGKPAIVSDIPAHREIADGFCEFFDPSRPDQLATLLRHELSNIRNPDLRPVADFEWPDWQASVRECLRECIAAAALGQRGVPTPAIHLRAS